MAPLQKRLEGVSELSKHKDDKVPLKQASKMPKFPFSFCVWILGTWGLDLGLGLGLRLVNNYLWSTCQEVDFNNLEDCIYNFACGLQRYFLIRGPKQFECTRFLVDGSHWTSKKKFREDSRSGEHLGCSSSYNFNIYKEFTRGCGWSQKFPR